MNSYHINSYHICLLDFHTIWTCDVEISGRTCWWLRAANWQGDRRVGPGKCTGDPGFYPWNLALSGELSLDPSLRPQSLMVSALQRTEKDPSSYVAASLPHFWAIATDVWWFLPPIWRGPMGTLTTEIMVPMNSPVQFSHKKMSLLFRVPFFSPKTLPETAWFWVLLVTSPMTGNKNLPRCVVIPKVILVINPTKIQFPMCHWNPSELISRTDRCPYYNIL